MNVQDFINDLGLDLAAEQVGENPDLPPELALTAIHFRLEILQYDPYQADGFIISGPNSGAWMRPHPCELLLFMAMILNDYHKYPDPVMWAAHFGLPDAPNLYDYWQSFAHDEERLMRLFGEDFDRFLALDPRRQE